MTRKRTKTQKTERDTRPELIIIAKPEAGLRAMATGVASATNADVTGIRDILAANGARLQPLFGLSEDRLRAQAELPSPHVATDGDTPADAPADAPADLPSEPLPDLSLYYKVETDATTDELAQLAKDLLSQDLVEGAYLKPKGEPPEKAEAPVRKASRRTAVPKATNGKSANGTSDDGKDHAKPPMRKTARRPAAVQINAMLPDAADAPPATPNFTDRQGYLSPAPGGIDAQFGWTLPGGRGAKVRVIDCEWGWRFTHEDLTQNQGGVVAGTSSTATDHGTAVLGVISGDRNAVGITGIAPDAVISASSFTDQSSSQAIKAAADKLSAGDIILLEIHRSGPNTPNPPNGQFGFIAIEWWPDDFAAIQYAVRKGIIVVEAAGNGAQNLDDTVYNTRPTGFPASWRNPFNPGNPSSGAVVVGAGAPPPNTHGANHGPDRSRLDFSNHGARVDVQGWGREVTTTGYGNLQGGTNQDLWYTDTFSGTSSASPIVVGALASVQGVLRARGNRHLNSEAARRLLRASGSPQQDAPGRPATQRIGNRPNLRQLIPAAARFSTRCADYNGDGRAEVLVTNPWGIGILAQSGSSMAAPMMAQNGTRFGGWLLNTADNHLGPVGDFDGDGKAEVLIASPWGVGVLEQSGATMAAQMMAANGTRFGGWLLNTADNNFGPAGDFDGDGKQEILITSPWGIGILKLTGSTFSVLMMAPNGTRFGGWLLNTADNTFGPVGDFDGDGKAEILVTSPWGIGVLKLSDSTLAVPMMAPNGTRFGGWLLNTADNTFGPVGDFDGDRRVEIQVTSPWGIGIFKLAGSAFSVPMMAPNGTRFGGWLLNTADNTFGPSGDFDGDRRAEILVTSPWGVGILKLAGSTLTAPMMAANGTRLGGWLLNTRDNQLGSSADFDGDRRSEIFIASPWGVGILEQTGTTMAAPMMAANGTRFGGWLLNSLDNDFGHGF